MRSSRSAGVISLLLGTLICGGLLWGPSSTVRGQGIPVGEPLEELGFLVGHWVSESEFGLWEETWSGASGGTMVASTKWVVDGATKLYEFQAIEEDAEEGRPVLLLRHFDPGLEVWKSEREGAKRFGLVELGVRAGERGGFASGRAVFERQDEKTGRGQRIVYEYAAPDRLVVEVAGEGEDGAWESEVRLEFERKGGR